MKFRRLIATILAAGAMFAVLSVAPQPAQAVHTSCTFHYYEYGCETGVLAANPRYHAIYMEVQAMSADAIECFVEDVNTHVVVGRLYDTNKGLWSDKEIRGLYGYYRMRCGQRTSNWGSGRGEIANNDYYFS